METTVAEVEVKDAEPVWETVEKAAPFLKLSAQALYAAVRENQLPKEAVLRIGRRIRINLNALLSDQAKVGK